MKSLKPTNCLKLQQCMPQQVGSYAPSVYKIYVNSLFEKKCYSRLTNVYLLDWSMYFTFLLTIY